MLTRPADATVTVFAAHTAPSHGTRPGLDSMSEGPSFGMRLAEVDVSGVTLEPLRLPESRLSWRWKNVYPLSGGCGDFRNGLEVTPDQATLSARRLPTVVRHVGKGHAWSWRQDACQGPLGDGGTDSEPLELAPRLPRNARIKDLRLLWQDMRVIPSGVVGRSRCLESSSSAATLRATIRRSQPQRATDACGKFGVLRRLRAVRTKRWRGRSGAAFG